MNLTKETRSDSLRSNECPKVGWVRVNKVGIIWANKRVNPRVNLGRSKKSKWAWNPDFTRSPKTLFRQSRKRIHPKDSLRHKLNLSSRFKKPVNKVSLCWSTLSGRKTSKDWRRSSLYWNPTWVWEPKKSKKWKNPGWPTSLCLCR